MKNNDFKREYDEYVKMENSLEPNQELPNNIKLLINKKPSNEDFIKSNIGSNLNLDYIPHELFMNFRNKKIEENENDQTNKFSFEQKNMKLSCEDKNFNINNIQNNNIINELIENENQNLKSKNVLESNHFNSLYFNDKSNELKTSKKNNTNTNTNTKNNIDFKISKNDFNLSESYTNNNDKNNTNIKNIFNNQNNITNNNLKYK